MDPTALTAAGASVATVGDSLSAAVSTLTGSFTANAGQDASGVMFGKQYESTASDLLKAVAAGVNACKKTGYGIQVSAVNYSRAEAQSDISGRAQPLASPPCPASVSAAGAPSAEGPGVLEPTLWKVVEFLVGDLWPNGDPAAMRTAAAAWRTFGGSLCGVTGDMAGPYNAISAQQLPEAELIKAPIRDIGTAFSSLGGSCQQVATQLDGFAGDVENTQNAIRDLLSKLGSVGGIAGMFFEFFKGHGEDELHKIADDINTVMSHLKNEASAKRAGVQQAEQNVDTWARDLEKSANREFTEIFGDHVGQVLSMALNAQLDSTEGGFRWLVSNAEGIEDMNPLRFAYDPHGALQTWEGIADLSSIATNPASLVQMALKDPARFESIIKGLARTDEWSKDRPMLGASQNLLDILTLPFAAGKATEASDIASAARRARATLEGNGGSAGVFRALDETGETRRATGTLDNIAKDTPQISKGFGGAESTPPVAEPPAGGRPLPAPDAVESSPAPVVAKVPSDTPVLQHDSPTSQPNATADGSAGVHEAPRQPEVSVGDSAPPHGQSTSTSAGAAPLDGAHVASGPGASGSFVGHGAPDGGLTHPEQPGTHHGAVQHEVAQPSSSAPEHPNQADAPQGTDHEAHHDGEQDGHGGSDAWQNDAGAYLDPAQNQAAEGFIGRARDAEPAITGSMTDVAAKLDHGDLTGLEYRLKTEDSLKEKLSGLVQAYPDKPIASHIADIKDSVRYTLQSSADVYAPNVKTAIDQLLSQGYECIKLKNSWGIKGYQGINSFWSDPASGHIFELQFHTPESFNAKMSTHILYEEQRLPQTPLVRQHELDALQQEIFGAVDTPTGAPDIQMPQKGDQP
ncbi:WXG100-like domain-containing protein [Mycolicibacterium sp. Dal123E01]|uniref:WXG100-like domain-containing protein n=1 Tax=Mycolicibacterium sp. Dal123E01 TaxID=3457578 RepID=UPI00403E956F